MEGYVRQFGEVQSIATEVEQTGAPRGLPLERELHAMAIVREALHNAAVRCRRRGKRRPTGHR